MTTKFLSDAQLDNKASRLLGRYESINGPISSPPVPIERIIEDMLDLNILWDSITESKAQSILAGLEPLTKTIVFNDIRSAVTTETPGLYNTVLAHEAGHWELHVDQALLGQQPLPQFERDFSCLYRQSGPNQGPKEIQAHKFMSYLLMPSYLLMEMVRDVDLRRERELALTEQVGGVPVHLLEPAPADPWVRVPEGRGQVDQGTVGSADPFFRSSSRRFAVISSWNTFRRTAVLYSMDVAHIRT